MAVGSDSSSHFFPFFPFFPLAPPKLDGSKDSVGSYAELRESVTGTGTVEKVVPNEECGGTDTLNGEFNVLSGGTGSSAGWACSSASRTGAGDLGRSSNGDTLMLRGVQGRLNAGDFTIASSSRSSSPPSRMDGFGLTGLGDA